MSSLKALIIVWLVISAPALGWPMASLPGWARAASTRLASVLCGEPECTAITQLIAPKRETGSKSLVGSTRCSFISQTFEAVPVVPISIV